jgi:transcriptional regulator with XRE-family HTH domain
MTGATQENLAKDAGISRNMLSQIERGEGNPSWVTLRGIAAALGVSVTELAAAAKGQK